MPAKKILFLSGKGGAGKTTLALATFMYLIKKSKKTHFFDFDVECPNAKLFFPKKQILEKRDIFTFKAKINQEKCKRCGKCLSVCMFGAIVPSKTFVRVVDSCKGCFACSLVCPNNAIEKEKKKIGVVEIYSVFKDFFLVSGSLVPGEEESMQIIEEMLKKSDEFSNGDYLIFDAEAGIKCPVLKLIESCDMIFLIVEYSKFGIIDGLRVLEAVKHLSKKCYVVLNKYRADLNLDVSKFYDNDVVLNIFNVEFEEKMLKDYGRGKVCLGDKDKMSFLEVFE